MARIDFMLNNRTVQVQAPADKRLVDILREDLGLTGTKEACGTGECGACTILIDGVPRPSCLTLATQLTGRHLTTIEGIGSKNHLHPVQQAFVEHGAVQCGFCTPGMVLSAVSLLERNASPTSSQVRQALAGNLCRCTGYQKIIEAVLAAAAVMGKSE